MHLAFLLLRSTLISLLFVFLWPTPNVFAEEVETTLEGTAKEAPGEAAFFRLEEEIVTSASKYAQKITEAPSAIAVITAEDIEKSGTLDIIQLFRSVPGVMVVETTILRREVIMRGFPQAFSPRLLVLMDGIPIYTPLFSGVTWGFIPFSLPTIDRIEVIRGASSTLYGANAFSGVINIINKKVEPKQSFYVYSAAGNLELTETQFVWNRPISEKIRFRLSGLFRHDEGYGSGNGDGQVDGHVVSAQGMLDFAFDLSEATKLKAYAYGKGSNRKEVFGFLGASEPEVYAVYTGFHLSHDFNDRQGLSFQATFHDTEQGDFPTAPSTQTRREVSSDLQYTHRFGERDTLVSGVSFRHGAYSFLNFLPAGLQRQTLGSVFVNNDFKIRKNLILTTGGRYEFDAITKHEFSGRGNLTYQPFENHTFRASVARAVRTPSTIEDRVSLTDIAGAAQPPLPPTALIDALGNRNLQPESVLAYEFGYLGRFFDNRLHANLQFYFNSVKDIITLGVSRVDLTATPPRVTTNFNNRADGQVYGVETELSWQPFDWWRTSVNYTLTRQRNFETGRFPKNLVNVKNRFAFKKGFSAELLFNWTDDYTFFEALTASGTATPVSQIFRLDVRLAQKFWKDRLEFAVVGQNLVDSPHNEENPAFRVDRLIYGMLSFRL